MSMYRMSLMLVVMCIETVGVMNVDVEQNRLLDGDVVQYIYLKLSEP